VFAISGAMILPEIAAARGAAQIPPDHITGFLLNIALIIFAWKRSLELKRTFEERDAARTRAHSLAYFDELTGLFNRRYLRERIERLSKSDPGKFALLLVDLDNFKKVNDIHGHVVGDDVLIAAAASIRETCPPDASCVRLGGDEFAVLVSGVSARE